MRQLVLLIFWGVFPFGCFAQPDFWGDPPFRYEDAVYSSDIKSVLFSPAGLKYGDPIIDFTSPTPLILEFDELSREYREYAYTLIHCTPDWKPTDLLPSEYLSGYHEESIRDYQFSFGTRVDYIHYKVEIPSENMRPMISGNYLLVVFDEFERENVILTRRLLIVEPRSEVSVLLHESAIGDVRGGSHQLEINAETKKLDVTSPITEFRLSILQNYRWDNAKIGLAPQFVRADEIVFDYDFENTFKALNEFRHFDIRSTRFITHEVLVNDCDQDTCQTTLKMDKQRTTRVYDDIFDMNGNYIIDTRDKNNENVESEYINVLFRMTPTDDLNNGALYITGGFNDYQCNESSRMIYNPKSKQYEQKLLLKQGVYNYLYTYIDDENHQKDNVFTEGSFWETENSYLILLYYQNMSEDYFRLVGSERVKSGHF